MHLQNWAECPFDHTKTARWLRSGPTTSMLKGWSPSSCANCLGEISVDFMTLWPVFGRRLSAVWRRDFFAIESSWFVWPGCFCLCQSFCLVQHARDSLLSHPGVASGTNASHEDHIMNEVPFHIDFKAVSFMICNYQGQESLRQLRIWCAASSRFSGKVRCKIVRTIHLSLKHCPTHWSQSWVTRCTKSVLLYLLTVHPA